jgi:hypothetical protein
MRPNPSPHLCASPTPITSALRPANSRKRIEMFAAQNGRSILLTKAGVDEDQTRKNRTKARVRAKVEWPFRVLKRVFGFTKVRYRVLKKNHEWLCAAFASINTYQHRRRLAKINSQMATQRA